MAVEKPVEVQHAKQAAAARVSTHVRGTLKGSVCNQSRQLQLVIACWSGQREVWEQHDFACSRVHRPVD